MPTYCFKIFDGTSDPERHSIDLPDIAKARIEGYMLAGQIISDAGTRQAFVDRHRIEVADESGQTLFLMDFTMSMTAAELPSV